MTYLKAIEQGEKLNESEYNTLKFIGDKVITSKDVANEFKRTLSWAIYILNQLFKKGYLKKAEEKLPIGPKRYKFILNEKSKILIND